MTPSEKDEAPSAKSAAAGGIGNYFAESIWPNLSEFWRARELLVWLLALVIGAAAAYAAIGFRFLIGLFQYPWLGITSESVFLAASYLPWWIILLAPAGGGLLVGLVLHFLMPDRRAQGVADVIEAQALLNSHISPRTGILSALVAAGSLGAGASAGREGPVVHLGSTLASWLVSRFNLSRSARRTLLAAGVAAAVSASFNVPVAGVLFAHEVILGHYALRAFVPITISSVIGAIIVRTHLGNYPAFIVPEYSITSHLEFPAFALLGVVCALIAIAFQLSLTGTDRIARRIPMPLWLRPAAGGLIVGGIAVFYPQVLGVGYDTMSTALTQIPDRNLLITLVIVKMIAVSVTLASRFGGGVFSPSLYLGAMTGGAFGLIAGDVVPYISSSHGLYAITGMGAVAAAILGAPISTTLIAFELTGDYNVTIALLLAISISTALHRAVLGRSYFHAQLRQRGIFLDEGPHQHVVRRLRVRDFMSQLGEDETPEPLDLKDETLYTLRPDDTVETALRFFDRSGHMRIPVAEPSNPVKIIGWADQLEALHAFNQALIDAHVEEHR